jgi:hypothetical protein
MGTPARCNRDLNGVQIKEGCCACQNPMMGYGGVHGAKKDIKRGG